MSEVVVPTVREVARIHYEIDDDLHRRAKAAAAMQGVTLKAFIEAALETAVVAAEKGKRTPPAARATRP